MITPSPSTSTNIPTIRITPEGDPKVTITPTTPVVTAEATKVNDSNNDSNTAAQIYKKLGKVGKDRSNIQAIETEEGENWKLFKIKEFDGDLYAKEVTFVVKLKDNTEIRETMTVYTLVKCPKDQADIPKREEAEKLASVAIDSYKKTVQAILLDPTMSSETRADLLQRPTLTVMCQIEGKEGEPAGITIVASDDKDKINLEGYTSTIKCPSPEVWHHTKITPITGNDPLYNYLKLQQLDGHQLARSMTTPQETMVYAANLTSTLKALAHETENNTKKIKDHFQNIRQPPPQTVPQTELAAREKKLVQEKKQIEGDQTEAKKELAEAEQAAAQSSTPMGRMLGQALNKVGFSSFLDPVDAQLKAAKKKAKTLAKTLATTTGEIEKLKKTLSQETQKAMLQHLEKDKAFLANVEGQLKTIETTIGKDSKQFQDLKEEFDKAEKAFQKHETEINNNIPSDIKDKFKEETEANDIVKTTNNQQTTSISISNVDAAINGIMAESDLYIKEIKTTDTRLQSQKKNLEKQLQLNPTTEEEKQKLLDEVDTYNDQLGVSKPIATMMEEKHLAITEEIQKKTGEIDALVTALEKEVQSLKHSLSIPMTANPTAKKEEEQNKLDKATKKIEKLNKLKKSIQEKNKEIENLFTTTMLKLEEINPLQAQSSKDSYFIDKQLIEQFKKKTPTPSVPAAGQPATAPTASADSAPAPGTTPATPTPNPATTTTATATSTTASANTAATATPETRPVFSTLPHVGPSCHLASALTFLPDNMKGALEAAVNSNSKELECIKEKTETFLDNDHPLRKGNVTLEGKKTLLRVSLFRIIKAQRESKPVNAEEMGALLKACADFSASQPQAASLPPSSGAPLFLSQTHDNRKSNYLRTEQDALEDIQSIILPCIPDEYLANTRLELQNTRTFQNVQEIKTLTEADIKELNNLTDAEKKQITGDTLIAKGILTENWLMQSETRLLALNSIHPSQVQSDVVGPTQTLPPDKPIIFDIPMSKNIQKTFDLQKALNKKTTQDNKALYILEEKGIKKLIKAVPQTTQTIAKAPNEITLNFKRYTTEKDGSVTKDNTPITIPENGKVVLSVSNQKIYYEITGVLCHEGTADKGHYVTLKKEADKWVLYNDLEAQAKVLEPGAEKPYLKQAYGLTLQQIAPHN